jgi:hypothetical protein
MKNSGCTPVPRQWSNKMGSQPSAAQNIIAAVTEKSHAVTDSDWGVCSWPGLCFALGRAVPCLLPVTNAFQLKHIRLSAVMFCTCEIIHFFSTVFCLVRALQKLDFRIVKQPTNGDQGKEGYAVTKTFLTGPPTALSVKGLHPRYAGQLHSLQ